MASHDSASLRLMLVQSNITQVQGLEGESSQQSEDFDDLIDDSELHEDLKQFANWSNRDDEWISMLRQRLGVKTNADETFGKDLMKKWVTANDPDFERITKEIEEKSLLQHGSKKSPWAESVSHAEARWREDHIQEIIDNMKHHEYGRLYTVNLNDCKWKEAKSEGGVNSVEDASAPKNPSAVMVAKDGQSSSLVVDVGGNGSGSSNSNFERVPLQMRSIAGPSECIGLDPHDGREL